MPHFSTAARKFAPAVAVSLIAFGAALAPKTAQAQLQSGYAVIGKDANNNDTYQHVDIGVAYGVGTSSNPGSWDLHIHEDFAGLEYAPDEALIYVGQSTAVTPSTSVSFLGSSANQTVYVIPQSNPAPAPVSWVGVGAEENVASDFSGSVTLSLLGVRFTPLTGQTATGYFAIWQNSSLGGTNVLMSTAPGYSSPNALNVAIGAHDHYNIGFSRQGFYEVTLQATGTPSDGGPTSSGPVTYYFGVGTTQNLAANAAAAPEPGSIALLLSSGTILGLAVTRRRRAVQ